MKTGRKEKKRDGQIEYNEDGWVNVKGCGERMRGESSKSCRDWLIGTIVAVLYS